MSSSLSWKRCQRQVRNFWAFAKVVAGALEDYAGMKPEWVGGEGARSKEGRSRWLHRWSRRLLQDLGIEVVVQGDGPAEGVLVSNHISYLDVIVLASVCPMVFVSKKEVEKWPVIGVLVRMAGTLFLDRSRRQDIARVNREMEDWVHRGHVLTWFPEGTSSSGEGVLPFFPSLFEPAIRGAWKVTPVGLRYEVLEGDAGVEVGYWGEMSFLPHFIHFMGLKGVKAKVSFGRQRDAGMNRKRLARDMQGEVAELMEGNAAGGAEVPDSAR